MAYGIKTPNKMPPGRRAFADAEVIRPGEYDDGQDRDGTPPSNQHDGSATRRGYTAGEKYREALRPEPFDRNNPSVMSKADKHTGKNSTHGEQPAGQERRELPASLPASHIGRPGRLHHEIVGHAPDGSGRFKKASHPEAEAQGVGNATFTSPPIKPKGMAGKA